MLFGICSNKGARLTYFRLAAVRSVDYRGYTSYATSHFWVKDGQLPHPQPEGEGGQPDGGVWGLENIGNNVVWCVVCVCVCVIVTSLVA